MGAQRFPWLLPGLAGILAAWGPVTGHAAATETWRPRVASKLLSVYDAARNAGRSNQPAGAAISTLIGPRFNGSGWVQVDVHYECSAEAASGLIVAAGLAAGASVRLGPACVIEGWIPPESLGQVASIAGVIAVKVPIYAIPPHPIGPAQPPSRAARGRQAVPRMLAQPRASSNSIDRDGVAIMRADQFVAQNHANGAGVTVGVQSAGVASLGLIQGRHELPAVKVVAPGGGGTGVQDADEGTALLEEVHAVAPGAGLAFCGPGTFVEYTSCLDQLIGAGATVLVDDVVFPQQNLMLGASPEAQAVEQILAQHPTVALFTAVGNYNGSYWEGQYMPVPLASQALPALSCTASNGSTQADSYIAQFNGVSSQTLTVSELAEVPIAFAWSDPPGQNTSKFDVYWLNSVTGHQVGCFGTASATDTQVSESARLPAGTYTVYVATQDASAAGKFLKLWFGGDGLTHLSNPTPGSVVTPQSFAAGAISIGAVNGSDGIGRAIEAFSSVGPITVTYPAMAQIQAPVLVAPDGIYVDAAGTYFAAYLFPDGNFYGTSASSPNAGGVGALLLSAFPSLTPAQLVSALKGGAVQLGSSSPDGTFGYGRIDAIGTLGTLPVPTITSLADSALNAGSTSPPLQFTVTGTGTLHFTVSSSNTTLIPASIVAAGSPGVAISPATCGSSTLTCNLSVTVGNGPSSTVKLTIAAVDGASRSATASMNITVTGNQAPTANNTTPAASSGGGGGTLGWWEVAALLTATTWVLRRGRSCRRA